MTVVKSCLPESRLSNQDIRWRQRFQNLKNAHGQFAMAVSAYQNDQENILYRLALVQSFEFTYELSWKTMKDYLTYSGVKDAKLPRDVFKQGFQFNIIENGQAWIDMLEDRNLMAHTYSEENAQKAVSHICDTYQKEIGQVLAFFEKKMNE